MLTLFEILDNAAKAFSQSDGIKAAYTANANIKQLIIQQPKLFAKLKANARAKNISMIDDPFRDQLISEFSKIYQAAKEVVSSDPSLKMKFPTGKLPEDVLLPYNIKVLNLLLADEYQLASKDDIKKEVLLNKFSSWINYLNTAINGTNSIDQYYLTQLLSALSFLKDQLASPDHTIAEDKNSQLGDDIAKQALERLMKRNKLSSYKKLPDCFTLGNFPFLNRSLISAADISARISDFTLDELQRQERIKICEEKTSILAGKIEKRRQDLKIATSSISDALIGHKSIEPQLDNDLTKLAILTDIYKRLKNPSLSPKEAIQASNELIKRRGNELLKSKYRIVNWLNHVFSKKPTNDVNFFSVMNKVEKRKSTRMDAGSRNIKTRLKS